MESAVTTGTRSCLIPEAMLYSLMHACARMRVQTMGLKPEGQERQVDMFQGEPVASRAEVTDVIMGKLNLCVARR